MPHKTAVVSGQHFADMFAGMFPHPIVQFGLQRADFGRQVRQPVHNLPTHLPAQRIVSMLLSVKPIIMVTHGHQLPTHLPAQQIVSMLLAVKPINIVTHGHQLPAEFKFAAGRHHTACTDFQGQTMSCLAAP